MPHAQNDPSPSEIVRRAAKIRAENEAVRDTSIEERGYVQSWDSPTSRDGGPEAFFRGMLRWCVRDLEDWQRRRLRPTDRQYELDACWRHARLSLCWLESDQTHHFLCFVSICDELGVDPELIREQILKRLDPQALELLRRVFPPPLPKAA